MLHLSKGGFRLVAALVVALGAVASPAHAISLPIQGKVNNSTETFAGTARVRLTGGGELTLKTNKGVACKGDFVHISQQKGNGKVTCEDGRVGSFDFVTAGFSGTGSGIIGSENFDFQIGK